MGFDGGSGVAKVAQLSDRIEEGLRGLGRSIWGFESFVRSLEGGPAEGNTAATKPPNRPLFPLLGCLVDELEGFSAAIDKYVSELRNRLT